VSCRYTITCVISSLLERQIEKRPDKVRVRGRILFLTEDPELIKKQLGGWDLPWDTSDPAKNPKLRDDISTDEITPAHFCFYFDRTLGEIPYVPRAVSLCGDVRGDSGCDCGEYRADLQTELPESGAADF
jgi:hypothetical protein